MSKLVDKRDLPIFIHSTIDDMTDLSPNAMRVYMHLARRANKEGVAWPSLQSIGDHCFVTVYKHADTRRKHAVSALNELIKAKLIRKEERIGKDGQQSNQYYLLDPVTVASHPAVTVESQGAVTVESPTPVTVASHKDTPVEDTPVEDTPTTDDEDKSAAFGSVIAAWQDNIKTVIGPMMSTALQDLIDECGAPAVIHGIGVAALKGIRDVKYVEKVAQNHAAGYQPQAQPQHRRGQPTSKVAYSMAENDRAIALLRGES